MDREKVIIGMSGGVDSSVTAMMMLKENLAVEGATMLLGEHSWPAINRAKVVCDKLGIKHHIVDLQKPFKEKVIDFFIDGYSDGRTPLPCAECNKNIKFHEMIEFTKTQNAQYFATGHYIRIIKNHNNEFEIRRAKDLKKDQTHFIFGINKNVLPMLKFPLGDFVKSDIKKIAKELDLDLDTQPESQDICFLSGKPYVNFLEHHTQNRLLQKGAIKHILTNETLGEHLGIMRYTIGQRRGIGVPYKDPLYVIKTDFTNNILYVGEEDFLYNNKVNVKNVNFIAEGYFSRQSINLNVCLRALKDLIPAQVTFDINGDNDIVATVGLSKPDKAITSGQACVFYDEDRLIGGGWIV